MPRVSLNGVPVGSGGGLPATAADELLDGATADRVFITNAAGNGALATPAEGRALLGGRVVDALSGTGWTAAQLSGTATATWATGPARLAFAVPSSTDGAAHAFYAGYIPEADEWDVLVRVDITAGDGAANTRLILQAGVDADNLYALALYADGTLEPGRTVGGSYTSAGTASGPSSGQRTGGQLWLRLSRRTTGIAAYWGVGSAGALPTSWTLVVAPETSVAAMNACAGTYFRIVHTTFSGGVVAGFAADVLAIRVTGQSGGAL